MKATLTFKLQYNPTTERLTDFRKKYQQLRAHVEKLQVNGVLPRGDIRWSIEKLRPSTDGPEGPKGPAQVFRFERLPSNAATNPALLPVHVAGQKLIDPLRIAM